MAIERNEKSIIVKNILAAKDKKEQVKIEAQLHAISVGEVKDILKEYDADLRLINGRSKKPVPETPKITVKQAIDVICERVAELNKRREELIRELKIVEDELAGINTYVDVKCLKKRGE